MKPVIKICGIKTEKEISLVCGYPVTYIGFIFAISKRQLSMEKASELRELVIPNVKVIGVFMNNDIDFVAEAVKVCKLNGVQLHGNEDNAFIKTLRSLIPEDVTIWKSIAIKDSNSLNETQAFPLADGLLLDTYHKGATGGTGHVFNWDLVKDLDISQQLILAGGLTPDNVVLAYDKVQPDILDLNSGLEVDLIKNEVKVDLLFERLKEAYDG